MKTHLFAVLILASGCCLASAQNEQYVTINVAPPNNPPTADYVTNTYSINQNQAAEVMSFKGGAGYSFLVVSNNGATFQSPVSTGTATSYFVAADWSGGGIGTIIQGPATFTLNSSGGFNALLTLKLTPEAFDPNKTLIVPPGTNHVQITLQVSPDLVNWTTATNGVYGSLTTAQFFRIREDNLVSP